MCKDHGIIFNAVNENIKEKLDAWNGLESRKIYADEYIDDKTINPNASEFLYADNVPIMLETPNYRQRFRYRIFDILQRYYPSDGYKLQHVSEDIMRSQFCHYYKGEKIEEEVENPVILEREEAKWE